MDDSDDSDPSCLFAGAVSKRQQSVEFDAMSATSAWVTQYLNWCEGGSDESCLPARLGVRTLGSAWRTQTLPRQLRSTGI